MRIDVDVNRCEGHGLCADVAPDVYGLDDDAIVVPKFDGEIPQSLVAKAEAGARVCPVAALHVVA
jgi:ferredoxin